MLGGVNMREAQIYIKQNFKIFSKKKKGWGFVVAYLGGPNITASVIETCSIQGYVRTLKH